MDDTESWYEDYIRDFRLASKQIDDWYQAYRKDAMPSASGKVKGKDERVKQVETKIRDFVLAGSGQITKDTCGTFLTYYGCVQHERHRGKGDYILKLRNSCDKPLCPECSKFGWAPKESNLIVDRFCAFEEKNFGQVEHIVISAPMDAYECHECFYCLWVVQVCVSV